MYYDHHSQTFGRLYFLAAFTVVKSVISLGYNGWRPTEPNGCESVGDFRGFTPQRGRVVRAPFQNTIHSTRRPLTGLPQGVCGVVHAKSWNSVVREAGGRERGMKVSYLNFRLPLLRTGKKNQLQT